VGFLQKIVDDCEKFSNGIYQQDDKWADFVKNVNKISFNTDTKNVISLSSLTVTISDSPSVSAKFEKLPKSDNAFRELVDIVDKCEELFKQLERTDIPYYMFVDEMEAYYGDRDVFLRDLTLIRDLMFTIHRLNSYHKVNIIGAVRSEIMFAMDRFISTNELNKILDGFCIPLRWEYNNTNSYNHPIIQILMKRIDIAANGKCQEFSTWFPKYVDMQETPTYILNNSWHKPRDIVRFLIAAQNDSLHCNQTQFSQESLVSLRKEYSKNSLTEIRQELQSLYSSEEIEIMFRLLRGGNKFVSADEIRKKAPKGSKARKLWDERCEDILEDFYRVGFWGNVNRNGKWQWRWCHKGETGVLNDNGWELAIHSALWKELSIMQ
jgi:hypothetical protein